MLELFQVNVGGFSKHNYKMWGIYLRVLDATAASSRQIFSLVSSSHS